MQFNIMILLLASLLYGKVVKAVPHNFSSDPTVLPDWQDRAAQAIDFLLTFYNETTGLFMQHDPDTPWYQTANAIQTILDYILITNTTTYLSIAENTIQKQRTTGHSDGVKPGSHGDDFRADSTDDTAWWALALLRLYTLTGNTDYLSIARKDEAYMWNYWDNSTCSGGLVWNIPRRAYHNAISNELYLELAASLHNIHPSNHTTTAIYLEHAKREWTWFKHSGMINSQGLINDGLSQDDACTNNGGTTWTYNQGVILGGLTELYRATHDDALLSAACRIADAVITSPTLSPRGILTEPCHGPCTASNIDAPLFKGVFVRNLVKLQAVVGEGERRRMYVEFLARNAERAYAVARADGGSAYGFEWNGADGKVSVASQSSAINLLTAVLASEKEGTHIQH